MKLTSRERVLLAAFSGLAVALIGSVLAVFGWKTLTAQFQENEELSRRLSSLQTAVNERVLWEGRDHWLSEHTETFRTREDAAAALLTMLNGWAEETGIELTGREIVEQNVPEDDAAAPYFHRASIRVTFSGTQEQVLSWIHALQRPEDLAGVTALSITAADRFIAEVEVSKWYFQGEPE